MLLNTKGYTAVEQSVDKTKNVLHIMAISMKVMIVYYVDNQYFGFHNKLYLK